MKILSLLILMSWSSQILAKTVARVLEVSGNAFVFYGKKDSKRLFYGDKVEDMSEVMVDDDSTVSLKDEYGRVYHLAGGTYVKVFNNLLEIKNGNVWVSSDRARTFGVINSVNSLAKFTQGQFVYSFDNISGKSQILVLTGDVTFSNALETNLSVQVPAGHFSFVDQNLADGLPRGATRVGLSSYKQVKNIFASVKGLEKTSFDKALFGGDEALIPTDAQTRRTIASVSTDVKGPGSTKGKLIFVDAPVRVRIPASVKKEGVAYNYYQKITQQSRPQKTGQVAQIRMFGFDSNAAADKKQVPLRQKAVVQLKSSQHTPASQRSPASVEKSNLIREIGADGRFESSLNEAIDQNKRHPEEVNQLIDELQSYDQSFQKNY